MALAPKTEQVLRRAVASREAGDILVAAVDAVDTLSGTETGFIDGVTAGTAAASKAVVLDASSQIDTIKFTTTVIVNAGGTIDFDAAAGSYATLVRDVNNNEIIQTQGVASAVNQLGISNAATGDGVIIASLGGDTDIDIELTPKGSGDTMLRTGKLRVRDGGTVTQLTSKTTGVTINKPTGQITMHNASLAAGAEATFTVTNSEVNGDSVILVNYKDGGTAGAYYAQAMNADGGGSFDITVTNLTGGALGEAINLRFIVFQGSTA